MSSRPARIENLRKALRSRVLVLDGAMGTAIQAMNLGPKDFGGEVYEGCNEYLIVTKPDAIRSIHSAYAKAGADILETNTFGGTPLVLAEFSLGSEAHLINLRAAQIAREVADEFTTPDRPRFVAGSIGPTTKALSVTGGTTFEKLIDEFAAQARALYEGGVDFFLIETAQDTRNVKAALLAIDRVHKENSGKEILPIAVSGTIEPMGTMLAGQNVEALYTSVAHRDLLYLGLNCATGPEFMTDSIRSLAQICKFPVACVPNAGLPDEDGRYLESPEMMARVLKGFADKGWINLVGGCCGTTAKHIEAFAAMAKAATARDFSKPGVSYRTGSFLSGIEFLEVSEDNRPVLVGERTNVIGSRLFKNLIEQEKWEEASEIARRQIKNQAQIIDICLANPDRDEFSDMKNFLEVVIKKITTPMMIDSTDAKVIEMALSYSQGKAIINSINLEDGEERFEDVCPLAKKYGAAVIVGCIDDDPQQGMGVTVERKLAIAERSYRLLTEKYGIPPEDIYWDALVFPVGTGDQNYIGSGVATIEGVGALKKKFPGTKTVLGISNVSFGLPNSGREVLNSVFLYHCTKSGLDLAIVNSEKLERFAEIPEHERKLCDDLLWNRGADPVQAFNAHFGVKKVKAAKDWKSTMPLEERLARYIVEGSKDGLVEDLNEALQKMKPLDIINGPLMAGMDQVGKLFNENKLIVAEVLQSAEAMKASVNHLEPFMEKSGSANRGKIVLATVKGDVHDIGKNLVEIILSNNGFEVINLGIKVPPQELIEAARKHSPQIIGLSGLLVKSAQQMVETASDLQTSGVRIPILVGGAALTRNFVDKRIAPAYGEGFVEYASDAMNGLELAKQIVEKPRFGVLQEAVEKRRQILQENASKAPSIQLKPASGEREIPVQQNPPEAPDFDRHRVSLPLEQVWSFINPLMLLGRHLGVKGDHIRALGDPERARAFKDDPLFAKAEEIARVLQEVKSEVRNGLLEAKAVYQFVPASSDREILELDCGSNKILWKFQRQKFEPGLCLADFVNPKGAAADHVGLFVTTAAGPVRETAEEWKQKGDYLRSHILSSLALETAEAAAELMHSRMRTQWGFPDDPNMTMMQRFQAKYRGKRYSFGYPACPELDYQKELFAILQPSDIGVTLTEGFMMSPEASVSAVVFSHPDAIYFGVQT